MTEVDFLTADQRRSTADQTEHNVQRLELSTMHKGIKKELYWGL